MWRRCAQSTILGPVQEDAHRHSESMKQSFTRMKVVCALQISAAVRGILGQSIAAAAPLMSAGLDSLGAVELLRELNRSALFQSPTTVPALDSSRVISHRSVETPDLETMPLSKRCRTLNSYLTPGHFVGSQGWSFRLHLCLTTRQWRAWLSRLSLSCLRPQRLTQHPPRLLREKPSGPFKAARSQPQTWKVSCVPINTPWY